MEEVRVDNLLSKALAFGEDVSNFSVKENQVYSRQEERIKCQWRNRTTQMMTINRRRNHSHTRLTSLESLTQVLILR
jgi:hypothetical protein